MPAVISHVFAGIRITDLRAAVAWYERLLGRPPDMLPNDSEATWALTPNSSVYIVADAPNAGRSAVTLIVEDIDAELAGVTERGLAPGPVDEFSNGVRKAVIADPDGNVIQFGEVGRG